MWSFGPFSYWLKCLGFSFLLWFGARKMGFFFFVKKKPVFPVSSLGVLNVLIIWLKWNLVPPYPLWFSADVNLKKFGIHCYFSELKIFRSRGLGHAGPLLVLSLKKIEIYFLFFFQNKIIYNKVWPGSKRAWEKTVLEGYLSAGLALWMVIKNRILKAFSIST